jgi:predicted esterase
MSVGLKDRIVPMDYAKELSLKMKTTYQEYDVEHTSTENMLNEVVKFIQNNLL